MTWEESDLSDLSDFHHVTDSIHDATVWLDAGGWNWYVTWSIGDHAGEIFAEGVASTFDEAKRAVEMAIATGQGESRSES